MKQVKTLRLGSALGYTIVEVMIFLIISGGLLASAGTLISGRQEKTRFADTVNDISLSLQDTLNDVATGVYSSNNKVRCYLVSTSDLRLENNAAANQGSNSECIFSGKLIYFPSTTASYTAYTLVTNKGATDLRTSTTELAGIGSNAGISDTKSNQINLLIPKVIEKKADNSSVIYKALLIVSDLGKNTPVGVSGNATKVQLYGYTQEITSEQITLSAGPTSPLKLIDPSSQVMLCLDQGGDSSRVANIFITPQLAVDSRIGTKDPLC